MNHIFVSVFPDEGSAYLGLEAVRELHREGDLTVHESVILAKDANATVAVRESSQRGPLGAAFGLTGGALIGSLGGPLGLAVGASVGCVVGGLYDMVHGKMSADLIGEVGRTLRPGMAALVMDADEISGKPVDRKLEALGAVTTRRTRGGVVDERLQSEVAAANAELDLVAVDLRDTNERALATARQRIQTPVTKIKTVDERLQAEMDRLTVHKAELAAEALASDSIVH